TIGVSASVPFMTASVSVPLGGVTDVLSSTGLHGVTNILPSTTLGSTSLSGVTGVPTLGLNSIRALPTDSGQLPAKVSRSSTTGALVSVSDVIGPVSVPIRPSALCLEHSRLNSGLNTGLVSASVTLVSTIGISTLVTFVPASVSAL
ncbi:hypothetical protein OC842_006101, partial [Tilletia horrida]